MYMHMERNHCIKTNVLNYLSINDNYHDMTGYTHNTKNIGLWYMQPIF